MDALTFTSSHSAVTKHPRLSSHPPRMKSTNVHSDSTLKDSRVTLATARAVKGGKDEQRQKRRRNIYIGLEAGSWKTPSVYGFDKLLLVKHREKSLTVPELMYFFFLPFFFGFKTFHETSRWEIKHKFLSCVDFTVRIQ